MWKATAVHSQITEDLQNPLTWEYAVGWFYRELIALKEVAIKRVLWTLSTIYTSFLRVYVLQASYFIVSEVDTDVIFKNEIKCL